MTLSIITPSYINSRKRFYFAQKSLQSLKKAVGERYPHIVVDDTRIVSFLIPRKVRALFPAFKWHEKTHELYNQQNVTLINRNGSGSATALSRAVQEARKQSAELVFIHLDDHIYIPILETLIQHALDALYRDPELLMVRFSGYPLIYNGMEPIRIKNNQIFFDSVILIPNRTKEYTLWWSYFRENTIEGQYWQIALWFCIYRLDFLQKLLCNDSVRKMQHLAHVELYYKNKENWQKFINGLEGKFGYINMQFGCIEMHRNTNWRELISLSNEVVK